MVLDSSSEEGQGLDLGPCCCCGQAGPDVRNLILLHQKAPLPGRGWGCITCNLPQDGAACVKCDACLEADIPPVWACRGYPGTDGRVLVWELSGVHEHDEEAHARDEAAGMVKFATPQYWLDDDDA